MKKQKIPIGLKETLKTAKWVCQTCGIKWGNGISKTQKQFTLSTWSEGNCDVCGQLREITQVRDFGYLLGQ